MKAGAVALVVLSALVAVPAPVQAHSASDAYLNLSVEKAGPRGMLVVHGQWDIALRDLDFVLKLDDDGDGRLRWGEVKHHQAAIERYAYASLGFSGNPGPACDIKPTRQMIDDHADGAYAVLFFDVVCKRVPAKLRLHYDLFFAIDPSHRGIFVMHDGANIATSVLSPQNDVIDLTL
jgi:hypothetical protein